MKNKFSITVLALLSFNTSLVAQVTNLHHTLNETILGYVQNVQGTVITNDSGTVAAMEPVYHTDVSNYGISFVKFNAQGIKVWNNFIYDASIVYNTQIKRIIELPDGSIVALGKFNIGGPAFIIKVNAGGTYQFAKSYGINAADITYDALEYGLVLTGAGGVAGNPGYLGAGIIKLDIGGNIVWKKTLKFASTENDYYNSARRLSDSTYIAMGTTVTVGTLYSNAIISKFDKNGNLLWTKGYSNSGTMNGFLDFKELPGKNLLVMGGMEVYNPSPGNDPSSPFVVKTDKDGNILWGKIYSSV